MPGLKSPVLVVLNEVVVWVSRKGERVQPERINRCISQLNEMWRHGRKVLEIVAENIVTNNEIEVSADSI